MNEDLEKRLLAVEKFQSLSLFIMQELVDITSRGQMESYDLNVAIGQLEDLQRDRDAIKE